MIDTTKVVLDIGNIEFEFPSFGAGQCIIDTKIWEPASTAKLIEILSTFKEPFTFLDIGAFAGYYTVIVASLFPHSSIYAFEPHPETYEILTRNVAKYSNVKTFNCAIDTVNGTRDFYYTSEKAVSSLRKEDVILYGNEVESMQVSCKTINDFGIDFSNVYGVKIDTQGTEEIILRSIIDLLPKACFILSEDCSNIQEIFTQKCSFSARTDENLFSIK
jgi:FkbM family methyltransferase